ncbi:MAG: hypothetical protein ACSHX6_12805 [Akkermansiaceae bacterium]
MKFFSRFFADIAIQVSGGEVSVVKGKLTPKRVRELKLLCGDLSLERGEIWIDGVGKVSFSSDIDERFHQRFRNVIFA